MASINYPQDSNVKGPWLIGRDSFEELDQILALADEKLVDSWGQLVEEQVQERLNSEDEDGERRAIVEKNIRDSMAINSEKHFELVGRDSVKLVDTSLAGLLRDDSLKEFKPKIFRGKIEHGGYRGHGIEVSVKSTYSNDFEYKISCSDPEVSREIKYELEKWVDKYRPSWLVRLWCSEYAMFAAWVLLCAAGFSLSYLFLPEYSSYSEYLKSEAHKILGNGIDHTNSNKAIEILLSDRSGYEPQSFQKTEKVKNPILMRLAAISVFLPVVILFRPKTIIGLGKNKGKYGIYKWWRKLITITLPLMLIVVPFWDALVGLIFS